MKYIAALFITILIINCTGEKNSSVEDTNSKEQNIQRKSTHQQDWENAKDNSIKIDHSKNYDINISKILVVTDESLGKFDLPKFTADGNNLIFTTTDYNQIWSYNITNESIEKIIELPGCGASFQLVQDNDKIIFINRARKGNARAGGIFSILSYSLSSKQMEVLFKSEKRISQIVVFGEEIFFLEGSEPKCINTETKNKIENFTKPYLYVENNILIRSGDSRDTLNFREDYRFITADYSKDGEYVFALTANRGILAFKINDFSFTQLDSSNSVSKLAKSNLLVYNVEDDDGERITQSELYIGFINSPINIKIKNAEGELRFNPDWSPLENKIAYSNNAGIIKIISFNIEINNK